MTRWSFDDAERVLDDFLGGDDPSDHKERKRIRIVRAATDLFIRHGYRRTSVDEIAREAGVAKGTVYLHFKTKADLLVHAVAREKKRYFSRVRSVLEGDVHPKERIRQWLRLVLVLAPEMPLVSRLLRGDQEILAVFDDLDPNERKWMLEMQLGFVTGFLEAAAPGQAASEALVDRAKVLLGFVYASGLFYDERIRGGLSIERFAEILADMLVDGIVPGDSSGRG